MALQEKKTSLQLIAGVKTDGTPVMESIDVYELDEALHYEMVRSPMFVRNLAAGDIFKLSDQDGHTFSIIKRSGNLVVRVFAKSQVDMLDQVLTPQLEKLGGKLDSSSDRALVYSIHVNVGFSEIEKILDSIMSRFTDSVWYYGNVYDPKDGVTPLNWWDEFINQV